MGIEFVLPELDYFTVDEIANEWNWERSDVEYLIYQEKSLRPAIVTTTIKEFHDHPKSWRFTRLKVAEFFKEGKGQSKTLESLEPWELTDEDFPEEVGPNPITDLPPFLYLDLANDSSTVQFGDDFIALRQVNLTLTDLFTFNEFVGFNEDRYYIELEKKETGRFSDDVLIHTSSFVVTRKERDRYIKTQGADSDGDDDCGHNSPNAAIAVKNLKRTIGALVIAIKKENDVRLMNGESINHELLAEYLISNSDKPISLSKSDIAKELGRIMNHNEVSENLDMRGVNGKRNKS